MGDNVTDDTPTLAEVFNFTEDDLAANRNGRLSEGQAGQLRARTGCSTIGNTVATLGLLGAGFWLVGVGYWWVSVMLFAAAAALFWLGRTGQAALRTEVGAGAVASVRGEAYLSAEDYSNPNGKVTEYVLEIDDQAFVISREAFAAFEDGDTYAVYFLPGARLILSAEQVAFPL